MNKTGFGFLRLPRLDPADEKSVEFPFLCSMVDRFLELGGDYFDTAYTYLGGMIEEALRRCGVDYFDVYLLHGLNSEKYDIALKYDQFAFLRQLKRSGKRRRSAFLSMILLSFWTKF